MSPFPLAGMEAHLRRFIPVAAALLLLLGVDSPNEAPPSAAPGAIPDSPEKRLALERLRSQPLAFVENLGQWEEPSRFVARRGGLSVHVFEGSFGLVLTCARGAREGVAGERSERSSPGAPPFAESLEATALRFSFEGCAEGREPEGLEPLPTRFNYFLGDDPSRWRSGVTGYRSLRYPGLYEGVDLVLREGEEETFEYDFHLAPAADLDGVVVRVEGTASPLRLDEEGALVTETVLGALRQPRPRAWEETARGPRPVECFYELLGPDRFRFRVSRVEEAASLVIDPQLLYSTYLGGGAATRRGPSPSTPRERPSWRDGRG
jgi:hypothetical protein